MEKLIKLLNEYREKELWYRVPEWEEKWQPWIITEQLISKQFWFIKWLVDNDKINKDLVSRVLINAYVSPETLVSLVCEFYDYYESLLMLLAISDTPIEDLIRYLRQWTE